MVSVAAIVLLRHSLNSSTQTDNALIELAVTVGGAATGAFFGALMAPAVVSRVGIRQWMRTALYTGAFGTAAVYASASLATSNDTLSLCCVRAVR